VNVAIAVIAWAAWFSMVFGASDGMLSARRLASLKYYTVQSNLLQGSASAVYAAMLAARLRTGGVPRWVERLKYAGTVSLTLTCATVLFFLQPVLSYSGLYDGVNLWFHLLLPLAAVFDLCLLDRESALSFGDSFIALAPTILYGIGYTVNLLANGIGTPPHTNDWYGFAMGGLKTLPLSYAVVVLATWGAALLERLPRRCVERH